MRHYLITALGLVLGSSAAFGDDPPPEPPRTHVETTVVDSASSGEPSATAGAVALDNDHHFEAGAPDIVKITNQLHLTKRQQAQVNSAIERADAGAAALIKREKDVRDMLAATTSEDPLYAKLQADQADGESRWKENRAGLRRDVLDILTETQRTRFAELEGTH